MDECHALFVSRLKTLWLFYMRSRGCKDFDALVDLVIADRLKDSLSGPCLKYCLANEGQKTLPAVELAALADTFDVRYRGAMVTDFKDSNAVKGFSGPRTAVTQNQGKHFENNTVHNISDSNRARTGKTSSEQKLQMQRKCWICSSPSHLQSACPKKIASNVKDGGPAAYFHCIPGQITFA